MSRRRRLSQSLLLTALKGGVAAVAVGMIALFAVGALVFHVRVSPVLTGSMRPTYSPGDVVITRQVNVHSLHTGDIAVFAPPGESAAYAHRITSVTTKDGRVIVTTRGDANPAADSWHAALNGSTVPKVIGVVPSIGRPMTWVGTPWLHAAAIAALGLLLTGIGCAAILRSPSRRGATA